MELVRWDQVEGVNDFSPGSTSYSKTPSVGHGRNRVLPLESGILPWTFLKVRIRISFAPSYPE